MNGNPQFLSFAGGASSLNAFGLLRNSQLVDGCLLDTIRQHESLAHLGSFSVDVKGIKRKWGDCFDDQSHENPLLVLGLGRSPSSSDNTKVSSNTVCTISSFKENDEESSMNLELEFELSLGEVKRPYMKKVHIEDESAHGTMLNLQLSLSTGAPESVMTSLTLGAVCNETTVNIGAPNVGGKRSESSSWFFGNYIDSPSVTAEGNPSVTAMSPASTVTASSKSPDACTSEIVNVQQQRSANVKSCQIPGCEKGARGASGLCIAHGGGRRCHRSGCLRGAEGRTIYCKAHGGGRRCQFLGCTRSAEGRTDFCIGHGGGRRCSQEGCSRAARGKTGVCIRHGGGKRCTKEDCSRSAEGHSGLCISHGGGRRCQYPDCGKGAQGSTKFCKAHGGGKRCTFLGCTRGAEGSTSFCKGHGGGKRCAFQGGGICSKSVHGGTLFCVAHGGGKRCASAGCSRSARGRTDYCVRHGGGKRCKSDGCTKSAQGSTDFCKAHGGGKRCAWGQPGSIYGSGDRPCDKFARSKTGMCAAHGALIEDYCVRGGGTLGAVPSFASAINQHMTVGHDEASAKGDVILEGRVHGSSLLALLSHQAGTAGCNGSGVAGGSSHGNPGVFPHDWV